MKEKLQLEFSTEELGSIFPYYILLDINMGITSYGESFCKLFPQLSINNYLFDEWQVVAPKGVLSKRELLRSLEQKFLMTHIENPNFLFEGYFKVIKSQNEFIFLGTLSLKSAKQLLKSNLPIATFFPINPLTDLLDIMDKNQLEDIALAIKNQNSNLMLYKNILNSTTDAIQVAYEDGRLLYINKEGSIRSGLKQEEIQNYRVSDFNNKYKEKPEEWKSYIKQLQQNKYVTAEGAVYNKNTDKKFDVEVTSKYVKFDNEGYVIAISRDISERKQRENQLKIQEEKYRNIISNMNLGLIEVDLKNQIVMCNSSFERMSGYRLKDIIGKSAVDLFITQKKNDFFENKTQERIKGISDSYEILTKNKRGEAKWWLVSGAPNYNDQGKIIGTIGIHLDITAQKELEKELGKALESAQLASKAKESFLANMSHEIRTPLNAILGMIESLQQEKLSVLQHQLLKNAQIASEHLLSIINNVLDIAKIEAGELETLDASFSLKKVIADVFRMLQTNYNKKKIHLDKNISGIFSRYIGDEARLRQILINLLGNALKFTEKGTVSLSCTGMQTKNNRQKIVIHIKDTGVGIDEQVMKKLFNKFQQGNTNITRKYGGTGLGLVITKELVELMNGELEMKSTLGIGTDVLIRLNLKLAESHQEKDENLALDFSKLNNKKILLVEDNEMNRMVVKQIMTVHNVSLHEAVNGIEAIEKIQKESFDLILMDIQMPIMDGKEATLFIRNQLKINIPIIALSANAFKSEIESCLANGFDSYVIKPFESKMLLSSIVGNLNRIEKEEMDNVKMYDLSQLKSLSMGDKEFVNDMIKLFVEVSEQSIIDFENAIESKKIEAIKKIAHKMKPSIDNMGIDSLTKEIRTIESFDLQKNTEENLYKMVYYAMDQLRTVNESLLSDIKVN